MFQSRESNEYWWREVRTVLGMLELCEKKVFQQPLLSIIKRTDTVGLDLSVHALIQTDCNKMLKVISSHNNKTRGAIKTKGIITEHL